MRLTARLLALAVALAALTQWVAWAAAFSHDARFLQLLADEAPGFWLLALAWAAGLALRRRLDPDGTDQLLARPAVFAAVLGGVSLLLVTPFVNAYFTYLTHPGLAWLLAWTAWPLLHRLGEGMRAHLGAERWLRALPWLLAMATSTLVFVQSFRRHHWFGSGGKDLGLFHQSVWLLSRFEAPHNTVMGLHAFGDHGEYIDLLAAPLQWIWPSAGALLLFQALLVGGGAWAVYELARLRIGVAGAFVAALVFVLGVDMQQAVMFDWNPTTCGAALMPWIAWGYARGRAVAFAVAVALVALCKENLILYALALCVVLALEPDGGRRRRWAWLAAALLAAFFVLQMQWLFGLFRAGGFRHLRFGELGETPAAMAWAILREPARAFALLWTPGAKIDGLLVSYACVAWVALLAPRYLIALAPIVLERFWSTHANRWWGHHYGAGAGVVATLAAIEGLAWLRARRGSVLASGLAAWRWPVALTAVLLACLLVAQAGRRGAAPLLRWRHPYYTTAQDRRDAQSILARIPAEASVAAQNHLLPHLSARRDIREIRMPIASDYVALDFAQSAWPFEASYPGQLVRRLLAGGYGVEACVGKAVLLRRGGPPDAQTSGCPWK